MPFPSFQLVEEEVASHLTQLGVAQLQGVLVVEEVVTVFAGAPVQVQVQVQVKVWVRVVESWFSLVVEGALGVVDLWLIGLVMAPH